jgi:hypothetical protein
MKLAISMVVAVLLLLQSGCGASGDDESASTSTPTTASSLATEAAAKAGKAEPVQAFGGDWEGLKKVAGRYADRLLIPRGPSPEGVVIRDLKQGTGPAIRPGDNFVSHYISFNYESGSAFEPYWDSSAGVLSWGKGERVQGWEPGLKGIRAGGIRELIVPSTLAYGGFALVYVVAVDKIIPN